MSGLFNGRDKCGYLGKERFATRDEAVAALAGWAWRKGSRRVQPRCVFCDGYHLTKGVRGRPGKGR